MARASHSGSCERGCGDQCSRQKFELSHLISPLYMKSHVPVFERHFCGFAPEPSLASRVMTRAIAPLELRWYCARSSQIKTQARVWIFPRRLAASANTTDLAVNVRIFLIKERE